MTLKRKIKAIKQIKKIKVKNVKESILIRMRLSFFVAIIFAAAIIVRIWHIQVTQGERWRSVARENRLKFIEVQATRGNILSDDGNLLATSLPFFKIAFDPTIATQEVFDNGIDSLSALLANYFQEKDTIRYAADFKHAREKNKKYILISRKEVKYADKKIMENWPIFKEGRMRGGVIFQKQEKRFKPFESIARRTIGFTRQDTAKNLFGRGLEYSFNSLLAGTNGEALYQKISGGRWKPISSDTQIRPENGLDIQTTIDIDLQEYSTKVLKNALYENEANYGCIIVMEVATGEIKTIVNLGKAKDYQYQENYNYAVGSQGVAEPGSTFKLASIMALLEETAISINDTVNTGEGEYKFYDDCIMRDAAIYGYREIPVKDVFIKSSNIGIAKLVFKHFREKPEKFIDYLDKFGLTQPLGFQMLGEGKPYIAKPGDETWSGCSLPWMATGYELKLSPLHLLTFYNGIANNGKMITPIIVKKTLEGHKIKEEYKAKVINKKLCSDYNLKIIQDLLEGVVERGTAKNIKTDKYKIAGKTGTTHKLSNGKYTNSYYTSFVGYFPADAPKYSCIVVIDDPRGKEHYGGKVAAPIFRKIADKVYIKSIVKHLAKDTLLADGVFPTIRAGFYTDLKPLTKDFELEQMSFNTTKWVRAAVVKDTIRWYNNPIPDNTVPNVVGMTLKDALFVLENQGLSVSTYGKGRVKKQSLKTGTKIKRGRKIVISLG